MSGAIVVCAIKRLWNSSLSEHPSFVATAGLSFFYAAFRFPAQYIPFHLYMAREAKVSIFVIYIPPTCERITRLVGATNQLQGKRRFVDWRAIIENENFTLFILPAARRQDCGSNSAVAISANGLRAVFPGERERKTKGNVVRIFFFFFFCRLRSFVCGSHDLRYFRDAFQ